LPSDADCVVISFDTEAMFDPIFDFQPNCIIHPLVGLRLAWKGPSRRSFRRRHDASETIGAAATAVTGRKCAEERTERN
jgi:hypothetical protein